MTQYAIVTDLNRCVACMACNASCKMVNNVPIGQFWNKVLRIGPNEATDEFGQPSRDFYYLPVQCQHCYKPECVAVCPTGASQKMPNGTVQID
ncbi:MAG: 4Fe-4S dicluster domain-containing protein, partial [Coriobacteriales bacterium]|nr:4Fe-4S dicluster domain-containing protein [Coriobacteriales bacterium]